MKSVTYLPASDVDRLMWLTNLNLKIPGYATVLGLSAADVTSLQNDTAAFNYIINLQESIKQTMQYVNAYKALMKRAVDQQQLGAMPVVTVLPPPAAVPEGMFGRIHKLVKRIKASLNYTDSIGADLSIIASVSRENLQILQPRLKIKLIGDHPHIKCAKGQADAMDLYVDRKDGHGFVLIGRLLKLDYIDKAPLPLDNAILEWSYKGRYVVGNDVVGLMSSLAGVVVRKI
ncbi:MAG: hypothetical protein V4580_17530 [Bacteroidota bacterium]